MIFAVLASGSATCGPKVAIVPRPSMARATLPVLGHGRTGGAEPSGAAAGCRMVAPTLGTGRNS